MLRAVAGILRQSLPLIRNNPFNPVRNLSLNDRIHKFVIEFPEKQIAAFKQAHPGATESEVKNYVHFFHSSLLSPINNRENMHLHHPASIRNKIILMKMLWTPAHLLSQQEIDDTLNKLGFNVRKSCFQNTIERFMKGSKVETLSQFSKKISNAKTIEELQIIFTEFEHSDCRTELASSHQNPEIISWEIAHLYFFISGRINGGIAEMVFERYLSGGHYTHGYNELTGFSIKHQNNQDTPPQPEIGNRGLIDPKLETVIEEMDKHRIPQLREDDSWADIAMICDREGWLRKQASKGQDPIDALREMYRRQPPTADWEKLVDDMAKVVGGKHESIFTETPHATKERKKGEELLQGLHKAVPLARQILADLEADKTGAYQIVSSALHKNDDYITIGIDAVDYIDFKSIDNRIVQTGGWMERYPMGTNITIPAQHSEEIINKLKQHRGIASIGRELTASGIDVQKKMRASYATRADDLKLLKSTATTSQLGIFSSNNAPSFVVGNEGYKPPKNPPVNNDTASNCGV